ncbi:MAG: hypothetical protein A3J28_16785 [Acidobacteria bacterium RIFCSPLOWO2_12_FULL_60_22]|nr:MAG: hypothetical protein A3J28_16785 [Acidobacteria bacterium RIFCSPLOWO2_12_FULL_60_22]
MRKVIFLSPAEEEMLETARFYESQATGLGDDFQAEVQRMVQSILLHPNAGSLLSEEIRRRILRKFPFGILYAVEPDSIIIVAVMHLRRKPYYWKDRF